MAPVIRQLKQRQATGSTEPIRASVQIELSREDAPGWFDWVVEEYHEEILEAPRKADNDPCGQPYVVVQIEQPDESITTAVRFFDKGDLMCGETCFDREEWEVIKDKALIQPANMITVLMVCRTFNMVDVRYVNKEE
jgi:hypothetical protein